MTETGRWLERASTPLRLAGLMTTALAGLAAALFTVVVGVWLARWGFFALVPVAAFGWWLAVAVVGVWVARSVRRHLPPATPRHLAWWLEGQGGWRRGSLWAVAERRQDGASEALFAAADSRAAQRLSAVARPGVQSLVRRGLGLTAGGGVAVLVAAAALILLRPTVGRAADLWRPMKAVLEARAPVRLTSDHNDVRAGEIARFAIEARGASSAILWTRSPGEAWRAVAVALDSTGHGAFESEPLHADLLAHATVGARHSDTVQVTVRQTLFVNGLEITAHFPPHVGRAAEPVVVGLDTVWVPAGTVLEVEGEVPGATLASAAWRSRSGRAALEVRGERFHGRFVPRATDRWELSIEARDGRQLDDSRPAVTLGVVPDRPPQVRIAEPASGAALPVTLLQPLLAEGLDDYGLSAALAVLRRVSRLGMAGEPWTVPLAIGPGAGERAVIAAGLDLTSRGLLPGDTVRLVVRVADNAPMPQWGESEEIVLVVTTLADLREATRRDARAIAEAADSVAARQRELARETEALAAERQRGDEAARTRGVTEPQSDALDFERAERARAIVEQQEAVAERVEEIKEQLQALERAVEASGMSDPEWQRQLAELEELLDRAITPELEERLRELRDALERLDEPAARDALERLAEAQAALRAELERSRELLERAAIEGALETLAQDAEELQAEQRRWVDELERGADREAAQRERQLAERADSLAREVGEVAERVGERGAEERRQALQASRDAAQRAGQSMDQAAQAAQAGETQRASSQGREAAESLGNVGQSLRDQREGLAQQWRDEAIAALDRSLAETARLAAEQQAVAEQLGRGEVGSDLRGRQGAVEQGVRQLGEQLEEAAGRNALLTPELAGALGLAGQLMAGARGQLERPSPNARDAAQLAAEALDALNSAAYALVRSRDRVAGSQSGSGLAEALEAMGELARQQGGLNGQAGDLLPRMDGSQGLLNELRRLAREQRALAEQLERLAAGGEAPSAAKPLAEEAERVARELEQGRLDPAILERQEQLFRRLLDAGRSLRDDEPDPTRERQSETATARAPRTPPPLPPGASGATRYPYPTWEELAPLTPEARRLILEYFRRLNDARPDR